MEFLRNALFVFIIGVVVVVVVVVVMVIVVVQLSILSVWVLRPAHKNDAQKRENAKTRVFRARKEHRSGV